MELFILVSKVDYILRRLSCGTWRRAVFYKLADVSEAHTDHLSGKLVCLSLKILGYVRLQVLTATSMKFRVFCDVAPCSFIGVRRRFRGA
jgi:hypothetical protein